MSRTIHYTDRFSPDSEVIDKVFYDSRQEELFVVLHSGTIAGYHSVPSAIYYEFASAESAGRYWNLYIKGHYGTLNGDVNFAPAS